MFPPLRMEIFNFIRPSFVGFTRDFPFFPVSLEELVELFPYWFKFGLSFFPDDINFGVVGDRF
jgi:hypothetical protein